jgi:hypothetical protein
MQCKQCQRDIEKEGPCEECKRVQSLAELGRLLAERADRQWKGGTENAENND